MWRVWHVSFTAALAEVDSLAESDMEWTIERAPVGSFVVVRTRGRFDLARHREMVEDILAQEFWQPGTDVLFDHRALDFGATGLTEMRMAQSTHQRFDERIGDGKAALLMGTQADFGVARQFELLTEDRVSARLRVFLNEAEAVQWLRLDARP